MFEWSSSRSMQDGTSSDSTTGNVAWLVAIILAFFLLLWEQSGSQSPLRFFSELVTEPSVRIVHNMERSWNSVQKWYEFSQRGVDHIARLENEVLQLQVDSVRLAQLEEENQTLQAMSERAVRQDQKIARWYGRDTHWFIDLGCQSGVYPGALVTFDGAFVGVIAESYDRYSSVRTWQDPSWRLATKVGTESAYGVFSYGRSFPEIEELPLDYADGEGALVRTAGQESVPPDYLLGSIQEVQKEPGFGTARAVVDPAVVYEDLIFVSVAVQDGEQCQK